MALDNLTPENRIEMFLSGNEAGLTPAVRLEYFLAGIDKRLDNLEVPDWQMITGDYAAYRYLASTGKVGVLNNANYLIYSYQDIEPGDSLKINAYAGYSGYFYSYFAVGNAYTGELHPRTYLNSSGAVTEYNNNNYITYSYDVTPGDNIKISAWAGYTAYYYAFYDVNGDFISGKQGPSGASVTLVDDLAIVPSGAVKLYVAANTTAAGSGSIKNMTFISGKQSESGAGQVLTNDESIVPSGADTLIVAGNILANGSCRVFKNFGVVNNAIAKWYGKKWTVIGDSLTEYNTRTDKNYHTYIADKTGIEVVNMGVGGTGYKNGGSGNDPFYTRVSNVPTDSDVVTIFGSFNDGLSDLGTETDNDTTTVGGCINLTIDNLYAVIPGVQLGIVSPTPWVGANPYNHSEADAYVELLEKICKMRSIPFLNLYYESNLRPWDSTFRALAYSRDGGNGVHPNDIGHALIAPRFEAFLDTLLLH